MWKRERNIKRAKRKENKSNLVSSACICASKTPPKIMFVVFVIIDKKYKVKKLQF
jgi:hypothetical protein